MKKQHTFIKEDFENVLNSARMYGSNVCSKCGSKLRNMGRYLPEWRCPNSKCTEWYARPSKKEGEIQSITVKGKHEEKAGRKGNEVV